MSKGMGWHPACASGGDKALWGPSWAAAPSPCRHRLVLPTHPHHLRHSQPAEQMRQQLAVPPPPEVLPGRLRQEMPLAPTRHPHVPRYRPLRATCGGRGPGQGGGHSFQGWGWLRCSLSAPLPLSPFPQCEGPAQTKGLLRIPVPPPVPAGCLQPREDCPAGDRDGDSSLPVL